MNKPNTIESVAPCSGHYSLTADLKLNAWFAVAALVAILTDYFLRRHPDSTPPIRVALVLSAFVPFLLYVRTCMRFIRGLDELQRRIQLEAWLIAFMGTLFFGTGVNMLNRNGVSLPIFPHGLGFMGAVGLTFLFWIVSTAVTNRRYK